MIPLSYSNILLIIFTKIMMMITRSSQRKNYQAIMQMLMHLQQTLLQINILRTYFLTYVEMWKNLKPLNCNHGNYSNMTLLLNQLIWSRTSYMKISHVCTEGSRIVLVRLMLLNKRCYKLLSVTGTIKFLLLKYRINSDFSSNEGHSKHDSIRRMETTWSISESQYDWWTV